MRTVKKVVCEHCGQEISASNYSKHIRRHQNHPETFTREGIYTLDHDDLFCKFCGKECKNKNSLTQHEIRCKENPNRKACTNKKFSVKGRQAWNKGLTKETDERVKKNGESVRQAYLSGKAIKLSGDAAPSKRDDVRFKTSQTILKKSANGDWHTSLAKNMHYNYNGVDLHGTWELKYAQYLDANNITWERCNKRFPYVYDGKLHYYTPDFYLKDLETFIEIKGFQTEKDTAKWEQFPKEYKFKVLKEQDLSELGVI